MNSEILFRSYFSHSLCSSWMMWIKYLVIWHNNRVATGTIFFVVRILEFRWPNYFYNFDSRVQFLRVSLSLSLMVRFVSCCQRFACNMRPSNVYYIYPYIPTIYVGLERPARFLLTVLSTECWKTTQPPPLRIIIMMDRDGIINHGFFKE